MSVVNLILLAIVPTVISNITLVLAVHNIGGTLTAVLGAMEPVTAVFVGVLVFGEPFTFNLAVGILLIIIAVTMIILSKTIQKTVRSLRRAHISLSQALIILFAYSFAFAKISFLYLLSGWGTDS